MTSCKSFVMLTADLARRQAKAAEAEIMRGGPRGPLHGIPYCLKDIVETAGIPTTAQSKLLADVRAEAEPLEGYQSFCRSAPPSSGALNVFRRPNCRAPHSRPTQRRCERIAE